MLIKIPRSSSLSSFAAVMVGEINGLAKKLDVDCSCYGSVGKEMWSAATPNARLLAHASAPTCGGGACLRGSGERKRRVERFPPSLDIIGSWLFVVGSALFLLAALQSEHLWNLAALERLRPLTLGSSFYLIGSVCFCWEAHAKYYGSFGKNPVDDRTSTLGGGTASHDFWEGVVSV